MICYGFKGGVGTSSRVVGEHTVGVQVQANMGKRSELRIAGRHVGRVYDAQVPAIPSDSGSIIIVVATDAPLLPHQLARVAKRAALGIGRTGSGAAHGSGEIILAFSTANRLARTSARRVQRMDVLSDEHIDPIFRATIDCVEESIANSICMAGDVVGVNGHVVPGLPLDHVRDIVERCTPEELRRRP